MQTRGYAENGTVREFLTGLGRAFAGALIFSLPMLMTMEMWWLGFYMSPLRLALLLIVTLPLLVGLSRIGGIRRTMHLQDDIADALVAVAVAFMSAAVTLWLFGLLALDMPFREIIGKIIIQVIPGSMGAMLAQNQLGGNGSENEASAQTYWGELFLMVVGALFLSFNAAPTEEMVVIAYKMTVWKIVALAVLSLILMHFIVYAAGFAGTEPAHPTASFLDVFARFSIVGYALVLLVNLYILWTFGRTDGSGIPQIISAVIVLSFPGAIGAAAARLIL